MKSILSAIAGTVLHGSSYFIYPGHFQRPSRWSRRFFHRYRRGCRSSNNSCLSDGDNDGRGSGSSSDDCDAVVCDDDGGVAVVVNTPASVGLPYEDVFLCTKDGVRLHSYLLIQEETTPTPTSPPSRCPTVLLFHGNSDNIGRWLLHAEQFYRRMGCNVFMLEYRGYGRSLGRPSEKGLQIDAQTALEYIDEHPVLRHTPIILYGQSLGGAVAIDLASRFPTRIRALILENTPVSIIELVQQKLKVGIMKKLAGMVVVFLGERWESREKLGKVVGRGGCESEWEKKTKLKEEEGGKGVGGVCGVLASWRARLRASCGKRWTKAWMSNRHNEDVGVDEDYVVDDRKTDGIRQRFYDDDEDDCELFTAADKVGIEPRERERDCSYSYPCRYSRVREDAGTERGRTVIGVGRHDVVIGPKREDDTIGSSSWNVVSLPELNAGVPVRRKWRDVNVHVRRVIGLRGRGKSGSVSVSGQGGGGFTTRKTKPRIVNADTGVTRHGSADIAILMLSGLRDTIVPPSHMRELWEIVRPDAKAVYSPCLVVPEDECGGEVEDSGYATVSSRRSAERQRAVTGEGQPILTPDLIFFGASDGAGESKPPDLNLDSEELSTWARWAKWSSASKLSLSSKNVVGASASQTVVDSNASNDDNVNGDDIEDSEGEDWANTVSATHSVPMTRWSSGWSEEIASKTPHDWRRCHFVEFERGGHNDMCIQPGYWGVVANFVSNLS